MKKENRKRIIMYALMSSMAASFLTGCGKNFKYSTNEDGSIQVQGVISYDNLSSYKFLIINYSDNTTYYIVSGGNIDELYYYYYDIYTNKHILTKHKITGTFSDNNIISIETISINDSIVKYNFIKDEYSIEDVNLLYDKLVNEYDQKKNDNKELSYTNEQN